MKERSELLQDIKMMQEDNIAINSQIYKLEVEKSTL